MTKTEVNLRARLRRATKLLARIAKTYGPHIARPTTPGSTGAMYEAVEAFVQEEESIKRQEKNDWAYKEIKRAVARKLGADPSEITMMISTDTEPPSPKKDKRN